MATATAPQYQRHALGLPAGSIRALLALGVLAYLWILAAMPGQVGKDEGVRKQASQAFIYLQFLMILILAHFFVAHGKTIGSHISPRSPLGLPRGVLRFLLLGGYLWLAWWMHTQQVDYQMPDTGPVLLMVGVLMAAFGLGYLVTHLMLWVTSGSLPAWFQDIQAWVALVAAILMGIVILVRLVINTSLPLEQQIGLENIEMALAAFVGFYFGARS
jgi:hypothetical protein